MYRFILGGAASGKTTYIYKEIAREGIRHPEQSYILFVPEQHTLGAQRELSALSERGGLLNTDVLSFTLLTWRVLSELGERRPDILDDMTRSLMLRKAMRLKQKELRIYGSKVDSQGLLSELKQAVAEFCQYDIDTERLRRAGEEGVSRRLSDKLHDISEIYECFSSMLESFEMIPEELPRLLLRLLPHSKLLSGAKVYFDGFTGYTPIQLRLIALILEQAESVSFAVTLPISEKLSYKQQMLNAGRTAAGKQSPSNGTNGSAADGSEVKSGKVKSGKAEGSEAENEAERGRAPLADKGLPADDTDIFWLSKESMESIGRIADLGGIPHGEDISLPSTKARAKTEIRCYESLYAEVRGLCRDIRSRVLDKNGGLRYSDIGVAVSDLSEYKALIKNEFDRAGISYFIDENASSGQSVTAEFILSALSIVHKGYRYEDVSRYSKNPLARPDRRACGGMGDIFDNYIRAKGLRGRRAYEAELRSSYKGADGLDLSRLNAYKEELFAPLFELHEGLREAKTIADYTQALEAFLERTGFSEAVAAFSERLRGLGLSNEAAAEEGIASQSLLLLSRMSSLMGEESSSIKGFFELLRAGLGSIKAGIIPQSMDMLLVGDLKRSRFDGIRYLYILGANEGKIPKDGAVSGIFTEKERDELSGLGISMAPQSARLTSSELFYLYLLIHKPKERLIISWPKEDRDGRGLRPAAFLRELSGTAGSEQEGLFDKASALHSFAEGLKREEAFSDRRFLTLYNYLRRDEDTSGKVELLMEAAFGEGRKGSISEELSERLYGDKLYGSVTRIESFERCAYAHFLRYGLGLSERQHYDIEAVDIGNLYHEAIEETFRELSKQGQDIREISEEELDELSGRACDTVTSAYNDSILQSSARNSFLKDRVQRITKKTLWTLQNQAKKGDFRTAYCELPFKISEEGLELHGRIDRVDVYEDKLDTYVRVIDYKSGRTRFDLSLIYHGLQLQLVTYMDVAMEELRKRDRGRSIHPAGLYYYNISDPVIKYSELSGREPASEEARDMALKSLRMNGLSNSDPDIYVHLDRSLSDEASAGSKVVPIRLKGGDIWEAYSSVCGTKGFERLMEATRRHIGEDAALIRQGRIEAKPYKLGDDTGCRYCPYHSVCGFDTSLPGCSFRRLSELSPEELKQKLLDDEDDKAAKED